MQALRRDAGSDCALITGSRFLRAAKARGDGHLLDGLRLVDIDEVSLCRNLSALSAMPSVFDKLAYAAQEPAHPALCLLAEEIARRSAFAPDVLISFAMPTDFLAAPWPDALRLHVEAGPYSRNPFPYNLFFDHLGMYARSVIGRAGRRLRSLPATPDGRKLVHAFRGRNETALAAIDPFKHCDFRRRFERICLLPLQVSDWYGFDELVGYRTQFEFLFDVLSAAPPDVGVVVTEYVPWGRLLGTSFPNETLDYLRETFPNMMSTERFRSCTTPSQFLMRRVDGAWSVSSSVGYQALLFGKSLGCPPSSHFAGLANATTFADFFANLGPDAPESRDGFLAWQLERYLVPEPLYADGAWLHDYLERRIDAARAAADPIDAFVPTAAADRLMDLWIRRAPQPAVEPFCSPEDSVLRSRSWRWTAPLRATTRALRANRRR